MNVSPNSNATNSLEVLGVLATILARARIERSLTRNEVADRVGVSSSMIDNYESAKAVPGSREWARYCNMVSKGLRKYDTEYRAAYNIRKKGGPVDTVKPEVFNPPKLTIVPKEEPKVFKKEFFGQALSKAMETNQASSRDVAGALDVSASAVDKWATGNSIPTNINMDKLIQLFPELVGWEVIAVKASGPLGRKPKAKVEMADNIEQPEKPVPVIPITAVPTEEEQQVLLLIRKNNQAQEALARATAEALEAEKKYQEAQETLRQANLAAQLANDAVKNALKL